MKKTAELGALYEVGSRPSRCSFRVRKLSQRTKVMRRVQRSKKRDALVSLMSTDSSKGS